MKFTTTFAALFSASTAVFAAPVRFIARDVWIPRITTPGSLTIWEVGTTYQVIWDLSQKPQSITNPFGVVYLSKNGSLDTLNLLAQGFPLTDGSVSVTIPTTTAVGFDYAVVLVGDSGNASQIFQIIAKRAGVT